MPPTSRQKRFACHRAFASGRRARGRARTVPLAAVVVAASAALCLGGCGGGGRSTGQARTATVSTAPAYAAAPYTPQQLRAERGGHLFVVDGCSACHAIAGQARIGPGFAHFAGDQVRLADGRKALVNERFLHEALLNPRAVALAGYPLQPMLAGVARLHFREHPADVAALATFIEQIGPENE